MVKKAHIGWGKDNVIVFVHTCILYPSEYSMMNFTHKAPITTAADNIHKYFFIVFQRK